MKKVLYSLLTLAAALTVASCQKEPVNASDPNFGGKPVTMTFDVNLGMATKADTPTASAFDDGTKVEKLYVAAFDATTGGLVSTSLVGEKATSINNGAATVKLSLAKGGNYNVVFFAMKTGKYTVNFADGNTATFAYTTGTSYKANDAENDAFYAKIEVTNAASNADAPVSVVLKRPFAQINVFSSNRPSETATYSSTMTVKQVPTSFDLFAGAVGTTLADMTFADNAIAATSPNTNYPYWLGMNYVLVPSTGKVALSFQEMNGMAEALNLTGITVKANNRTNLVGAIYDLNADMTYNVTVGGLDGEGTGDIAGEEQTITVAGGSTYTTTNPLSINAAAAATQSVTLSFNGNSIADVNAGSAENDSVTVESSDENVATAAVSGNDVVITAVGNGDAVITVSVPGYTKATYKLATYEIPVHVEGVPVPKKDVTITVTAPTDGALAIETSKTGTITATAKDADNNDVAIVYTSSDETVATVNAGTVTGVKAGTATITLSTAETETLNAAESKTITVTVTDPETPAVVKTLPYAETFLEGIGDFTTDGVKAGETDVWTQSTQYGMVAKAFVNNTRYAVETLLTSPLIDLGNATAPTLYFSHAGRYLGALTDVSLQIKEEGGNWANVAFSGDVTNTNFNYIDNEISLASYVGKKIQIAFKYTSTTDAAGTYEVKNFKVEDASTPIETTVSVDDAEVEVGSTTKLSVTTNNAEGTKSFSSNNTSIATVDANGVVTGVAAGTATITTTIGAAGRYTEKSTTSTVTVVAAGTQTKVSIDFTTTDAMPEGFPTSSSDGVTDGTYTINGYSFTIHASNNFYWGNTTNLKALLIGKADSYVLLPAIEGKKLVTVKFHTGANASSKVTASINSADGETAVHTVTDALTKDTDYTWVLSNTAANTRYRFSITNANNFQFATLELVYE